MRKFRNAAIAAATAVSLTFAGTTIASAQETDEGVRLSSGSSAFGFDLGAWSLQGEDEENPGAPIIRDEDQVTGGDLLGDVTADDNPQWAESWKSLTTIGIVGSIIGAIIGGVNWLKFQGILPA